MMLQETNEQETIAPKLIDFKCWYFSYLRPHNINVQSKVIKRFYLLSNFMKKLRQSFLLASMYINITLKQLSDKKVIINGTRKYSTRYRRIQGKLAKVFLTCFYRTSLGILVLLTLELSPQYHTTCVFDCRFPLEKFCDI